MQSTPHGIETPDQALERVRDIPGLTANQLRAAENWALNENRRRAAFGMDWVKGKRAEVQSRSKELRELIHEVNQQANDLRDQLGKRELSKTDDGFKQAKAFNERLVEYEQELARLRTTHATAEEVAEDPAAYFHSFYAKYPALWDRVPRIEEAL